MKRTFFENLLKLTLVDPDEHDVLFPWAQGQPVTDSHAPIDPETGAIVQAPPKVWLTFGLDHLAPLRYAPSLKYRSGNN